MTPNEIQQSLDTNKECELPAGVHSLPTPLFLDADTLLCGRGRLSTQPNSCGTGVVVGWKRGLISDDHWTATGYRTTPGGDQSKASHLWVRGSAADLGPNCKWSSITNTFTLRISVYNNESTWAGVNGKVPLCGINASNFGYSVQPYPYVTWTQNGDVYFAIRLQDDAVRIYKTPQDVSNPNLDVTWTVPLDTGIVTAAINGQPAVTAGTYGAHPAWPNNARLMDNSRWPLGIGRMPPTPNANGYCFAEGPWPDLTIREFEVFANGLKISKLWPTYLCYPTYDGGPRLPIVHLQGQGCPMFAVHKSQGASVDSVGGAWIDGIEIYGNGQSGPAINLGAVEGGLKITNTRIEGCARGVQNTGLAVTFPVTMDGIHLGHALDAGLWLLRAIFTLDRSQMNYCARVGLDLIGCSGSARDVFMSPGGYQALMALQSGGAITYERLLRDSETMPAAPCIAIEPATWDLTTDLTTARVRDCTGGRDVNGVYPAVIQKLPKAFGYPYDAVIDFDNINLMDQLVV